MYRILEAECDGDLYADACYDQTTPFYNMLMEALETAKEKQYRVIPVVQLDSGAYDFYAGNACWFNGSGIQRSVPIQGAAYIEVHGAKDGETVLRLHGSMQWMFFALCEGVKFMDLQIEYADDNMLCPLSNPRGPAFYPVGVPDELDRYTMVFDRCKSISFERVKVFGQNLSWVFSGCQDITLRDVSGTTAITALNCTGVLQCQNVDCSLISRKTRDCAPLLIAPDMKMVENAVIVPENQYEEDGKCVCHI